MYSENPKKTGCIEVICVNANMKLILAPELSDKPSAKNNFFELLSEYENIQNWLVETSNVSSSEYAGQVKMNLCNKCDHKSKSARPKQEEENVD